jgi:sugar transferase (PEP-CTERM/EpsH1 system associated)
VPYPLEKGDKLRAFHQLKTLAKRHDIYLFALSDTPLHRDAMDVLSSFCKEVRIFRLSKKSVIFNAFRFLLDGKPLQCGYFYNQKAQKSLDMFIEEVAPDHLYAQLIRTAEYIKDKPFKKTIDYQDLFSQGLYRRMQKASELKRFFINIEYQRVKEYEKEVFHHFDNATIITQSDKDFFDCCSKEQLTVVPNGVDTSFFTPAADIQKQYDLIFTGNMSYLPNVNAAEYIAKELLPLLVKRFPHIRILLCGATPSRKVLALSNEHIDVTGWVEDIRPYYAKSRIFFAPMRLGTGLQNKLLEAMAMRIPCITSPLAGTPLGATAGKELFICNSMEDYLNAIEVLLSNSDTGNILAENAYRFLLKNFNWEETTGILERLIINS